MSHKTNSDLMLTMDLMPTILEFCRVENTNRIDGISLLPALIENQTIPERDVFWANAGSAAMQSGNWKLVWQYNSVELYNMMIDPKEQHDLSTFYPEKTEEMKAKIESWWNNVTANTKLEGEPFINANRFMMPLPYSE